MIARLIDYAHDRGFFHLLVATFLTQFLGFGTALLVAKFLSASEFGTVRIVQSYAALFVLLGGLGLNAALLRYSAEDSDTATRAGLLRSTVMLTLVGTTVSLLLLWFLCAAGIMSPLRDVSFWAAIYGLSFPAISLTSLLMTYLQALRLIHRMALAQAVVKLQSFVVIVACTWIWGLPGFIVSTVLAYYIGLWPLLREIGLGFLRVRSGALPSGFGSMSLFALLGNGINLIGQYGDLYILDHFATDRQAVGYYSLATVFVLGATLVTGTVQTIVTPYFSRRSSDPVWFRRKLLQMQTATAALSVGVGLLVFAGGWVLVHFFFGPAYLPVLDYLWILLIKFSVWSSCAICGAALLALGLTSYNLAVVAINVPFGLVLGYHMFMTYGPTGLAWAQTASAILQLILVFIATRIALSSRLGKASTGPSLSTPVSGST